VNCVVISSNQKFFNPPATSIVSLWTWAFHLSHPICYHCLCPLHRESDRSVAKILEHTTGYSTSIIVPQSKTPRHDIWDRGGKASNILTSAPDRGELSVPGLGRFAPGEEYLVLGWPQNRSKRCFCLKSFG